MQGPVGHVKNSGFYLKTNGEVKKGFQPRTAMISFMLGREQEWTQESQIGVSSRVLWKYCLLSTPSVNPISPLLLFPHHHLLSVQPPLH